MRSIIALAILVAAMAVAASPAVAQSAPGQVASVTVTRANTTLTASWDAPAGATKYHVTYSSDNKKSWSLAAYDHATTSIDITGIDTSKAYVVGVRAGNEHGWGQWRNSASNNPSGPPARVSYVLISRSDGSITASWPAVVGADKYHVTYSSDGKKSWSLAAFAHSSTSITINVDNQYPYVVGVRAGKTDGGNTLWGNWRNSPASAPWVPADPPPSAPANVSLSRACEAMSVSWTPVSGATGYDVNVSTNKRKTWKRALSNVTYTSWNFAKWSKNKTYTLAVRARNAAGESGWTNSATVPPPSVCAVSGLRAVTSTTHGTDGGTVTTTWNAGQGANAYNVNYRADGGQWQRIATDHSTTTHTHTVTSTAAATVAVQATNGGATSQWRNAPVPGWLTAGSITGAEATLTLAGHSGAWHVKKTAPAPAGTCSSAISGATHTFGSLSNNTSYSYSAYHDSSCSTELAGTSFTTTGPTAPAAPAAPALTTGNAQLAAQWTAPSNGGSAINDYDLRYRQVGTTDWTRVSDGGTVGTTPAGGSDTASSTDPIDFGNIGAGITRESLGSHQGLYKVSSAIDEMEIYLQANNGANFTMRTANSKPSALNTGTVLASSATTTPTNKFREWVGPIAANGYFWASPTTGSSTYATRFHAIYHMDLASTATAYTITGLTNGTAYQVSVRAGNSVGDGEWSDPVTLKPGLPARPAAPTLAAGNQQITVSWTPPSGNGSAITDYDLRYSSDSGATWTVVTDTTSTDTTASITGLDNGTAYIVQVRAGNTHGDGLWSPSSASASPQLVPVAPAAPALTTGNAQLGVAWTAPADGGSAITGYNVRYQAASASGWSVPPALFPSYNPGQLVGIKTSDGSAGSAFDLGSVSLSGLTISKVSTGGISNVYKIAEPVYRLRLKLDARNANNAGQGALTYRARYASTAPTTSNMNTHGTLLWEQTASEAASITGDAWTGVLPANTHFWITTTSSGSTDSFFPRVDAEIDASAASRSLTITGLTNGTSYNVQVRAFSAIGRGAWSPSGTLKAGLPAVSAAPTLVSGDGDLAASWAATSGNGSAISDYDIRYSSDAGVTWTEFNPSNTSTTTSTTITGLTNHTAYVAQVRATNTHGDGLWSPSSASVKPGRPDAPAAPTLASGNATLTATWTAPADNGRAITSYGVEYSTDGTTWSSANVSITFATRTATITGLTNNTAYRVRVRATNSSATGPWSASTTDKPGRPPAMTAPTLTAGTRQLTVTWTAPTPNGSAITDYDVQYRKSGATGWSEWAHTGTAVTATITGLEGAATYEARVRAKSAAGEGGWSPAASLATNAGLPNAPDTPTLLLSTNQITVQWTAPYNGGASITGFKVRYKASSSSTWSTHTFTSDGTTRQTAVASLTLNTSYDFQVLATNTHGDGAWSATATGTAGAPQQPVVTLTPSSQQLAISWTAPAINGSAITDYDVRYRQTTSSSWVRIYDGGSSGIRSSFTSELGNGPGGDPINFGTVSPLTNESNGFYKFGSSAIDEARIHVAAYTVNLGGDTIVSLRTHSTKPSSNIHTAGTQLASLTNTSGANKRFDFPYAFYGSITAGHYFWVTPDRSQHFSTRSMDVAIDLATTATSYTLSGLTNNTEYEVQVRAKNARGDGQWSASAFGIPSARTLTSGSVTATGATLTISGHTGSWHYKANAAPHTTCSSAVSGTTETLTGLTPGTSYTYTVYKDSSCVTALAAAAAFTTDAALTASGVTATGATLNLAGHTGNWHYQADTGPDTSCSSAVSATTETLTGLSPGTAYTYKAYSDSACTTANLLGTATFTTAATLTVSDVTATSATLTITGHTGQWWYKANTGPDSTCQGPVASGTSTESVTGLTANTTYTYKAYSASGCADTNLLATASSFLAVTDFDADDDGLIEVGSLAQLNAMRWDLDGNGTASGGNTTTYATAFPDAKSNMGCNDDESTPSACTGYELTANLDFDTNGSGTADSGDTYWNSGAGWTPIGDTSNVFTATFDGGGFTLSNLHINASTTAEDATPDVGGLFAGIGSGGAVINLGLENVSVTVSSTLEDEIFAGALAADNRGAIIGVWSSGSVTGSSQRTSSTTWIQVGGLVGVNDKGGSGATAYEGTIGASYSTAAVTSRGVSANGDARAAGLVAVNKGTIAASYASGSVRAETSVTNQALGNSRAGGLVAINNGGTIIASYATGNVSSNATRAWDGGLVGRNNNGTITASYSTGTVGSSSGANKNRGGLVGTNEGSSTVTTSYWDTTTSGKSSSPAGTAKTTSELQTPTGYTGIYATWNVNVDDVTGNDDPWDFGTANQYPILEYGDYLPAAEQRPALSVSNISGTGATLTIIRHPAAWRYKATTGPHTSCSSVVSAGTSTATLTGLTANTTYTYTAYSDSACSTALGLATSFKTAPAPTSFTATRTYSGSDNSDSVELSWTAPDGTGITAYETAYSTDSGTNWTSDSTAIAATATSRTITGLHKGNSYIIRIRAVYGTGNNSAWVQSSSLPALAAPGTATGLGGDKNNVHWTAPSNTGNGQTGITKYNVQCKRAIAVSDAGESTTTSKYVGGNQHCNHYSNNGNYFRVRAFNLIWGSWSGWHRIQ